MRQATLNRRKMLGGLGCAAAAGALLPVVVSVADKALPVMVQVPTLQDHFTWKLDHVTKALVGTPERGPMRDLLDKTCAQAIEAGIPVKYHYGTVCGPRTERISIIDAIWWRIGRDGEYQAAYDPALWEQDGGGHWFMRKDTPENEKLTLIRVSDKAEFVYGGSL